MSKVHNIGRLIKFNKTDGYFLSLRTKFIISFLGIVLILFVSSGYINYQKSEKVIYKNVYSLTMANIAQISTNIDHFIKDAELLSDTLINNNDFLDYVKSYPNPPSTIEELQQYNRGKKASSYIAALWYNKLLGIYALTKGSPTPQILFLKNYVGIANWNNNNDDLFGTDVTSEDWYKQTINNLGKPNVIGINFRKVNINNSENVVSIAREFRDPSTLESLGIIIIDFDYNNFNSVINPGSESAMEQSELYVLDKNNSIMYCKNGELLTKKFDIADKFSSALSGSTIVNFKDDEYFMVYYTSPYSSWKVVSLIPFNVFANDINFVKSSVILLTIICLFIAFVFSSQITLLLLKPIKKLIAAMSRFEKGDFSTRLQIRNHDETKLMADSFNSMASSIENLVNKVYLSQLRQKEAELTSLQSQINPHFLYNTLESIRGVAIVSGIDSIAEMSKSLSMLFRYNINNKKLLPISEEIKNIENYIIIQNFRYEDKFDMVYDIPQELHNYKILKLTLQPLVENSIKHGLEMKLGKGKIEIRMRRVENTILMHVYDDGIGMSGDEVVKMNEKLSEESSYEQESYSGSSTGIGVQNVNTRIRLYFGEQYGLKYVKTDIGTLVEVTLPITEGKE